MAHSSNLCNGNLRSVSIIKWIRYINGVDIENKDSEYPDFFSNPPNWGKPNIAGHESPRTTKLCKRTHDEISLDEIERILI